MWKILNGLWTLLIQLLTFTSQGLTAVNTGMGSINLKLTMYNNENRIKNKQSLDTLQQYTDLSKLDRATAIYAYGIRLLNSATTVEIQLKQHEALVTYIDSIDISKPLDDYTLEVRKLMLNPLTQGILGKPK